MASYLSFGLWGVAFISLLLFFFNQLVQRCWRLQCHCLNMAVNLVSITHCTPLLSCCVQVCPSSSSPLPLSSSFPSSPSFTPLLSLHTVCSLYDNFHDPSASKGFGLESGPHLLPLGQGCAADPSRAAKIFTDLAMKGHPYAQVWMCICVHLVYV